jgi:hypothetical protein
MREHEGGGDVRCVRRACFVYIGLFPERLDDPGAVFAPVLRGVVLVARGVTGPPERRLICFVRAMLVEDVDVQDERGEGAKRACAKNCRRATIHRL